MKTGVYRIRNIVNEKSYIGSAQISFRKRRNQHFHLLREGIHHCIYLQRAWNKYGEKNFVFEVLEECEVENCLNREQWWLDNTSSKYNIQPQAQSRKGTKLSKSQRIKAIERLEANRWKLDLPEIRKKMSDAHKGVPKTKEHSLKVGAASKKKVLQYNKKGKLVKEWDSIGEAETFYGAVQGTLWKALTGKTKTFRKHIWKYKNKQNVK